MRNIRLTFFFLAMILVLGGCVKEPTKPAGNQSVYANNTQVNETVQNNTNQIPSGCAYNNPSCSENSSCENDSCVLKAGCQYSNPVCNASSDCVNNTCILKAAKASSASADVNNVCTPQFTDTEHMDIFDSHTHIMSKISASQIISEMDKAGVNMANLYPIDGDDDSSSLDAIAKYPDRFITFVDTPDSPQPATWFKEGQAFVTQANTQLSTGKFYGIGETNLRYYSGGGYTPPPDIYIPPDSPLWLALVNLSARYHVPISFHFIPDDPAANAALERMLSSNKDAVFIWAHLGFNEMPLNSTMLNNYLLKYPNLYFDTAGIQNMQNPPPQPNSNWGRLTDQSSNGRLNEEWRQFFETWNSRILFGSDAGGGGNGEKRWLNYADNTIDGATPNAIGHWRQLFSNLDQNAAHNILSANARGLFLKEQKNPYSYSVSSHGNCYSISISSTSSVSGFGFDPDAKSIIFTVADSTETAGSAIVTIPATIMAGNFTAQVDGQSVQINETSSPTYTAINLGYAGGIRTVTLTASTG